MIRFIQQTYLNGDLVDILTIETEDAATFLQEIDTLTASQKKKPDSNVFNIYAPVSATETAEAVATRISQGGLDGGCCRG